MSSRKWCAAGARPARPRAPENSASVPAAQIEHQHDDDDGDELRHHAPAHQLVRPVARQLAALPQRVESRPPGSERPRRWRWRRSLFPWRPFYGGRGRSQSASGLTPPRTRSGAVRHDRAGPDPCGSWPRQLAADRAPPRARARHICRSALAVSLTSPSPMRS